MRLYFRVPPDARRTATISGRLRRPRPAPGDEGRLRPAQPDPRPAELADRRRRRGADRVLPEDRRRHRRARPRLHRPGLGHPVPRRPVPGPLRSGPQEVRAAADAGVRRGVHPRPHARPGDRGVRAGASRGTRRGWSRTAGCVADDRFRMIDPACGSGHFLLGGFARLLERWQQEGAGRRTTASWCSGRWTASTAWT